MTQEENVTDCRTWEPIVWANWEKLIPPRSLWVGPQDPVMHFFRWVWEYRAYLTLLCGLRRDSAVLELGCSHGRTALGLLDYLTLPGRYEGLDIVAPQIEFAQRQITPEFPNFKFTVADIRNDIYNPHGSVSAEEFWFPYEAGSFDVVYAASLFTHLLPLAAEHYFQETRRVLKPGGRCLFSFFVLDYYRGTGTTAWSGYEFDHSLPNCEGTAVHDPARPEAVLAFRKQTIENLAERANLRLVDVLPGIWSRSVPYSINEQDLVLLEATVSPV